jgi:hypothetical protein
MDADGRPPRSRWQIPAPRPRPSFAPNTATSNGATLKFRLRVSDASLSSTADVTVNVVWVNDPPVARLACPMSLLDLNEGQTFVLDGSASSDTEAGT